MLRRRRAAGFADDATLTPKQALALLGGGKVTAAADDTKARATADAIIKAAARARADGSNERPRPTGLSAKIIAAGRKRREPMGGK
jgi:hypothetical protein